MDIRHIRGVPLRAGELEATIEPARPRRSAQEQLAQGWVDVKIELPLDVVAGKLAEMCLVPPEPRGQRTNGLTNS